MRFGLTYFPTDYGVQPAELGRAAEAAGFEALFVAEHTHIPAIRDTPRPGGGELPRQYWHTHDPFVALTAVAAATERLRIGTGVCLIIERDPIVTAKEVASLDRLSGGRLLFGIGAGWNREEMENHGTDPHTRFSLMRERVEAMKAIWTEDEAEYHGRHVSFDPVWSWPKPLQEPHPPVILGGNGPKVIDRVLAFADEWMPNWGLEPDQELIARFAELRARADDAGRGEIPIGIYGPKPELEILEPFAEAGVSRVALYVPPHTREKVEPRLDRYAQLVSALA